MAAGTGALVGSGPPGKKIPEEQLPGSDPTIG